MTVDNVAPLTAGDDVFGKTLLDRAIEAYYDDMRNAVRRRGMAQVQATEVVHDLYLTLSRHPERLAGKSSLRAFMIRAAINLGIDRARRIAFENRLFAALDEQAVIVPLKAPSQEARLDVMKRVEILKNAIAELPRQCRTVFIAYRIGGMSKEEIAESLGIKRRMVDRHLRNALLSCMAKMASFE
ncbi:RNA polymerase sigma factor [Rhizobium puerariae]|uniref:RNA polymerase sigma factor n=1 Tax=Rhizobium puerariae TaxID=1585791 RepID=A0ABV6AER8_9HYPH